MRTPKLVRLLAMVFGLMLLIAACGDVPDEPEDVGEIDAEDPDEEEEPEEEEPEEEPVDEEEPEEENGEVEEAEEIEVDVEAAADLCTDEWAEVEADDDFTVGLVTDIGSVDDGTFNQYAYEGVLAAIDCFGIDEGNVSVIETASEADYDRNLSDILTVEPDVVVTVGFLIQEATEQHAEEHPETNFVGVDQFVEDPPDNFVGLQFREDQGGFLAGAMAGLMTESDIVAAIGGPDEVPAIPRFLNGYESGVQHVNDAASVLTINIPDFTAPAEGRSAAEQFIGEGADVVFGAAGPTGSGGIQAAAEADAHVIGVDQDEYYTTFDEGGAAGADRLLTSAVKRIDVGVFQQVGDTLNDEFEPGTFTLDAENEGITYAPFHEADVPDEVAEEMEEIREGLADGSIDTGVDPATGEPLE